MDLDTLSGSAWIKVVPRWTVHCLSKGMAFTRSEYSKETVCTQLWCVSGAPTIGRPFMIYEFVSGFFLSGNSASIALEKRMDTMVPGLASWAEEKRTKACSGISTSYIIGSEGVRLASQVSENASGR